MVFSNKVRLIHSLLIIILHIEDGNYSGHIETKLFDINKVLIPFTYWPQGQRSYQLKDWDNYNGQTSNK